jgi:hypothetical protein
MVDDHMDVGWGRRLYGEGCAGRSHGIAKRPS